MTIGGRSAHLVVILFSPMRGGSYHPKRCVPGTHYAVQIILDLGFRSDWQLSHNLFVAERNLGDDSNYGPSPLGQRRL
jgi:hypothetical protein